jgi:ElaB/YqjD/DUF883 family membrane-anchored ribosome-binding protein
MANVQEERKPNTPTATNQPNRQETPPTEAARDTLPDPRNQGRSWQGHEASHPDEARDTSQGVGTQILDKAQEVGTQIRDTAQEVGTQIRDKAQEMGAQAQQAVGEYYEQGRESLREMNKSMEEKIREKPLQSLLVAGGVGLLLGLLWRRG